MIALVVVTDGRNYLPQAVASLREQLTPFPTARYIVDDSGSADYGWMLSDTYRDFDVHAHTHRLGFAATVADAWRTAIQSPEVEYVFHAEDDFTYNEPVDLERMVAILDRNPNLAQLALKRQPVNSDEHAAGDITRVYPDAWYQHADFLEHTRNLTTNPSLIPRRVIQTCLRRKVGTAEMELTRFLQGLGYTFGYLGDLDDAPRVEHIGEHRAVGAHYP